jgi:hypothetical protein
VEEVEEHDEEEEEVEEKFSAEVVRRRSSMSRSRPANGKIDQISL